MTTAEYTWRTLNVGKVNHAIARLADDITPDTLAVCGREGQFSVGHWLPYDSDKRDCLNCVELIKTRNSDDPVGRHAKRFQRKSR